jgi:amino acid transporter
VAAHVESSPGRVTKVVVATTVMLSFISFWRAAAIVLNDLGSSAFYVGGIAEHAVGRAAPWFVLAVMLFSYAVRSVYVESCAMFTRGGVYRVVKEAMGGTFAKISVSALMFDYVLTGPISGVSAGQYIVNLTAQTMTYFGYPWSPAKETVNLFAAGIAVLVTIYFWWRNTRGVHESSDDALKIMKVTTVMVVMLVGWSVATIVMRPEARRLPPAPIPAHLSFHSDAVGWLPNLLPSALSEEPEGAVPTEASAEEAEPRFGLVEHPGMLLGLVGILIAFGHSLLAMSGEESLAQVNRELEYPKHKNLMRAGMVIFVYSLLFTSLVSFFAYAIIPDSVRPQYFDNLISGVAMNLVGPEPLRLLFQAFIVIVGFLMLAGAVNTAIIGSNGVLNRVSEDGVLTDWFRAPHHKYGTTYRLINMIVVLQLVTILGSRGDVFVLGEAYAFGVIWSFTFNALAMLTLRFHDPSPREWKVPLNLRFGKTEIPLGLALVAAVLALVAVVNLVTKEVATISGFAFTVVFFTLFTISERANARRRGDVTFHGIDQFRLNRQETVTNETVEVRPGNTLCVVRDYNTLEHLKVALDLTHTGKRDLVVMTVRVLRGPNTGYEDIEEHELFTSYEQKLFTRVVALAEKAGKHVDLLVVPSSDVFDAIAHTAAQLDSFEIVAGRSSVMPPEEQARRVGDAWDRLPNRPRHEVLFRIAGAGEMREFRLGTHAPELTNDDITLIHDLWLRMRQRPGNEGLHHRDVVTLALRKLGEEVRVGEGSRPHHR